MLPCLDRPTFCEDKRKWNLLPRILDGHHHFSMGNFDPKETSLKIITVVKASPWFSITFLVKTASNISKIELPPTSSSSD